MNIPEGKHLFVWLSSHGTRLIMAVDREEAYKIVINRYMAEGINKWDAVRTFAKDGEIRQVIEVVTNEPASDVLPTEREACDYQ